VKSEAILITGVGRRTGLYLSQNFLSRGIPVIGTYRRERDSLKELQRNGAELYQCDFNNDMDIKKLGDAIFSRHKRLRAIIHNASEWLAEDTDSTAAETLARMMNVHVSAPYQLNLSLTPLLQASSHSHADIIHIGDYVSSRGSKKHIAYAASKAAQDNLTLSFAAKLAPKIKVNSIAPALVLFNENDEDDYRWETIKKSPMQREGGLDEFQHAVDYLLDSTYVTGRILPVDGGRHLVSY
jgi:dihydromonapterin reductase / dihydrofolate reductase